MQERRTTVRVAHASKAQYCATDDLLPREGRISNLSDRGAGVLLREPRREGEQITASVSLPGDADPMTVTGSVRWSSQRRQGRWYPAGLEWLPLEEALRNRLHTFLSARQPSAASPTEEKRPSRPAAWWLWGLWTVSLAVAGVVAWLWITTLQREARRLREGVAQRSAVISVLKQREEDLARREALLQQELGTARAHLATATGDIARLEGQSQSLAGDAQRLGQEVTLFQQSYAKVQEERTQLVRQVIDLEQERLKLLGRLSSLPELHVAIREAIEVRNQAKAQQRRQRIQATRGTDTAIREGDNQGFVVRSGQSTLSRGGTTMSIRVLDPEASPSKR